MAKIMFNKQNYIATKSEIIDLIKDSLPEWKTTQGFLSDGIYAPDIYEKQELKIMVLLGETYGYNTDGMNEIERQPNLNGPNSHVKIVPTINKVSKLLWLINKSIEEKRELNISDFPKPFNDIEKLKDALLKVAWVNVKKESGNVSRQKNNAIYDHAKKNKQILKRQIESIAPDLIIVGSEIVMRSVCELSLFGKGILHSKKNIVQENSDGQKILYLSHPSYFRHWSHQHIFNYYKIIYENLMFD